LRNFKRTQLGVSSYEFSVALMVVSVGCVFFLSGLVYVQEQAEKTALEQMRAAFEKGLQLEAAHRMASGQEMDIAALFKENPVRWLQHPPSNYLGEYQGSPPKITLRANWYYDVVRHELVYRINLDDHFRFKNGRDMSGAVAKRGTQEIRFSVVDKLALQNPQLKQHPAAGRVSLEPMNEYAWF